MLSHPSLTPSYSYIKSVWVSLIISGVSVLIGYVISNPLVFGVCSRIYAFNGQVGCLDDSISAIGGPLLIFASACFGLSCLLLYKSKALMAWLRFALWWLPLSAVVIFVGASGENSWTPYFSYSETEIAAVMASLFTIISLGIIAWKQFNLSKVLH